MQTKPRKSILTSIIKLTVIMAMILASFVAYTHADTIYDWWRLRDYSPPAPIAKLASDTTMTPKAKNIFYATHPQIDDKDRFNQNCPAQEQTIILGCYISGEERIYIYNVTDDRLNGVKQVTAAHEMLHAAYARLDEGQRTEVDGLLQSGMTKLSSDQHLAELIKLYNKQEPGQLLNEMHSILGTEYSNLSPQLEQYYSKYFTDRSKVVKYANQYRQIFDDMKAQIASSEAKLKNLNDQITNLKAEISAMRTELDQSKSQLDNLRSSNPEYYNAQVPSYNQLVNSYNAKIAQLKSLIDSYNRLVSQHNSIAIDYNSLNHELDSNYQPIE